MATKRVAAFPGRLRRCERLARPLSSVVRRSWDKVENESVLEPYDLERANVLALAILKAIGIKEQAPARLDVLTIERRRAFIS